MLIICFRSLQMFEKFSNLDIDSAGSGGEYTVQAGFGWTNGVVLWVANAYGSVLDAPKCPNITADAVSNGSGSSGSSNSAISRVSLSPPFAAVSALLVIFMSGILL